MLEFLYHWSPSKNRKSIKKHGLQLFSYPTLATAPQNHIAFSTNPKAAWKHCRRIPGKWDLWVLDLTKTGNDIADKLNIDITPFWGDRQTDMEIRILYDIPAKFLWLVGNRQVTKGK